METELQCPVWLQKTLLSYPPTHPPLLLPPDWLPCRASCFYFYEGQNQSHFTTTFLKKKKKYVFRDTTSFAFDRRCYRHYLHPGHLEVSSYHLARKIRLGLKICCCIISVTTKWCYASFLTRNHLRVKFPIASVLRERRPHDCVNTLPRVVCRYGMATQSHLSSSINIMPW